MKPHSLYPTLLFTSFFLLSLTGCVNLSPSDLATANFGFYPDDYQKQIKLRMGQTLFDPYSAHYQMGDPYRAGSKLGLIYGGGWRFGGSYGIYGSVLFQLDP